MVCKLSDEYKGEKGVRSMQIIRDTTEFNLKNSCVTLGKFDGVHLGHRKLISTVVKDKEHLAVVFTFDPLPDAPMKKLNPIYTDEEQEKVLAGLGVQVLIRYPFSKKEAAMSAEDFVKNVLIGQLDAKHIVVGNDFHFGHACMGDYHLLEALSEVYGYQLTVHDKLKFDGEEISSSRIRTCIETGDMNAADYMLGK